MAEESKDSGVTRSKLVCGGEIKTWTPDWREAKCECCDQATGRWDAAEPPHHDFKDGACIGCGERKPTDDEVIKAMDKAIKEMFERLRCWSKSPPSTGTSRRVRS